MMDQNLFMYIYRGQLMLGVGITFALVAVGSFVCFNVFREMESVMLILFTLGCFATIMAGVSLTLSYVQWVPKWERDERRTGRVPGQR